MSKILISITVPGTGIFRKSIQSLVNTGMCFRRELEEERGRVGELLGELERERRQVQLAGRRSEAALLTCGWLPEAASKPAVPEDHLAREAWRTREYELERLVAQLELKVELLEREERRLRETAQRLETELHEERERANAGQDL